MDGSRSAGQLRRKASRDLGQMALMVAIMAAVVLPVAWMEGESGPAIAFGVALAVGAGLGFLLRRLGHDVDEPSSAVSMSTVALAWLVVPAIGMLPLFVSASLAPAGSELSVSYGALENAWFEAMSGFTSTGLTLSSSPSELPASIQLWRSLTQWVGGGGVILFGLALLTGSNQHFSMASTELNVDRFAGDRTLRRVALYYCLYSLAAIAAFFAGGMPTWEALNHGLTAFATGGFTVTNESFGAYSPLLRVIAVVIMLLGALSFKTHHRIWNRHDETPLHRDTQLRTFLITLALGFVGMLLLAWRFTPDVSFEHLLFQWVSALCTCGFASTELDGWAVVLSLWLMFAMLMGGASGSTSGGLKQERVAWLAKAMVGRVVSVVGGVRHRFDGKCCDEDEAAHRILQAATLFIAWLATLATGTLLLYATVGPGWELSAVAFEASSALGSVGLSAGVTSTALPASSKLILTALMWLGRLEIIAALLLFLAPLRRPVQRRLAQEAPAE